MEFKAFVKSGIPFAREGINVRGRNTSWTAFVKECRKTYSSIFNVPMEHVKVVRER